jgi:hypothetical protein
VVKEAVEIQMHPQNFNREAGFTSSQIWPRVLRILEAFSTDVDRKPRPGLSIF